MISATNVPGILRVVFVERQSENTLTEIVCYIRPLNGSIEINYSHHQHSARLTTQGPWSVSKYHRMALDAATLAKVQYGVFHELWLSFGGSVRVLPGGEDSMNMPLSEIPW